MDSDTSKRLHEAAEVIKDRAAELASWSRRIPRSLEISEEEYAVVIRANPAVAPQARAFELGKRHPLNYPSQEESRKGKPWAPTPHRPFLENAVDQTSDRAAQKVAMVIEDWTRKLGYKAT